MPEYRIAPDQGVCPEGHPCHVIPDQPTHRECAPTDGGYRYTGAALVDVYTGPIGVEAFHEAAAALRALIRDHEAAHDRYGHDGRPCAGAEVCATNHAFALRAIQDALDPLPREDAR